MTAPEYLFTTPRLGVRPWQDADIPHMARISADPEVMRFFPAAATYRQTEDFVRRMQQQYADYGYCYFPLFHLESGHIIGFTGLMYQTYAGIDFMPCTDIGWRLDKAYWGKGLATEAAQASLTYGFRTCGLDRIYAVCPVVNTPSERVIIKLGMKRQGTFHHPRLEGHPKLQRCYYYAINKDSKQ